MIAAAQTTTGGPSLTVGGWIAWVIIAGALALAATAIWKAVVPVVKAARLLLERWEILEGIAEAFRPNGHPSLPDTVHKISADQDVLTAKVDDVAEKVKDLRHDVIDVHGLETLSVALGSVPTVVGAMSRLADEVKALRASGGGAT